MKDGQRPGTLLIVKPGSMGDVIHALPVASAIRQAWPDTAISWFIDPRWLPLLEGNPNISKAIPFPREKFHGITGKIRAMRWARKLSALKPDMVLDLQGLLRSALVAKLSKTRSIHGLSDAREGASFFYHRITKTRKFDEHAVPRYLRVLPDLGIPVPDKPEIPLPEGRKPDAEIPDGFILLHPFSRGRGKSMDAGQVQLFCETSGSVPVVVVGGQHALPHLPAHCVNLLGKTTLLELIWLIRHARFTVSVDSGPMHLAAAITPDVLSIHTRTDPRLVGPFNEGAWVWQGGEIRIQQLDRKPDPERDVTDNDVVKMAKWVTGRMASSGR